MTKDDEKTLEPQEIGEILKLVAESEFDELYLEMKGLKLVVRKTAGQGASHDLSPRDAVEGKRPAPDSLPEAGASEPTESSNPPSRHGEIQSAEPHAPIHVEEEGLVAVKAPMLGIFYRAPAPGAPPFVEVSRYVEEEDTVCLIEIMKLFHAVKAGVRGRIMKICAENEQVVEDNQTLFLIEPASNSEQVVQA